MVPSAGGTAGIGPSTWNQSAAAVAVLLLLLMLLGVTACLRAGAITQAYTCGPPTAAGSWQRLEARMGGSCAEIGWQVGGRSECGLDVRHRRTPFCVQSMIRTSAGAHTPNTNSVTRKVTYLDTVHTSPPGH